MMGVMGIAEDVRPSEAQYEAAKEKLLSWKGLPTEEILEDEERAAYDVIGRYEGWHERRLRRDVDPGGKGRGSWYHETVIECAVCGRTETIRERRWTEKPDDPADRCDLITSACTDHFL